MRYKELKREDIKGLSSWQLYTLTTKKDVLGVFIDGLEYGDPTTGEYFTSPVMAFFQALRMCGYKTLQLRKAYERKKRLREEGIPLSTNGGTGKKGEGEG